MTRGRIILLVLLAWALAMVVPDLRRVLQPLGSLGLYADNDGLVYNVVGPFRSRENSPAWQAGLRPGDRLDLGRMRCLPYEAQRCADALAALGGVRFLPPGRRVTVDLAATAAAPARQVVLEARQRPSDWLVRGVLLLGGFAAIAVLLAAAWLVWRRPGRMSWGFFLYAMWFNPGQVFEFYGALQAFPPLLLAQSLMAAVAQAAGYAGLLQFALRVPRDELEPRFARIERLLPWVAGVLALPLLASLGSLVGFGTELVVRSAFLAGFAVAVAAVVILRLRRPGLPPIARQRLRWVIWGCLIGLPAFVIGELGQQTTIFRLADEDYGPSDEVSALLALVNGVLFLFVFEALRRPRVVNVAIPLRRVTVLGLVFSVPTLLLHHWADHLQCILRLPEWSWLLVGALVLFLISSLHHLAAEWTDELFNRRLDQAEEECGRKVMRAGSLGEVEGLLVGAQQRLLALASAAVFWRVGEGYRRAGGSHGWNGGAASELRSEDPLLAPLARAEHEGGGHNGAAPFALREDLGDGLPKGLARPVLAVPIGNRLGIAGVALYGPHESGADLDASRRCWGGSAGSRPMRGSASSSRDCAGASRNWMPVVGEVSRRPTTRLPFARE